MNGILSEPLQLYAAGFYEAAAAGATGASAAARAGGPATEQQWEFLMAACEQQLLLLKQQPQQLQQKHPQQLQQMLQHSNPSIKALAVFLLLTRYCQSGQQQQKLQQELQQIASSCPTAAFLAAAAAAQSDPIAALRLCNNYSTPDMRALRVELLLRIHREDTATSELEADIASGTYETVEQSISRALCHLWGGDIASAESAIEDVCIFDASSLKRDTSSIIENARAVCALQRGDHQTAIETLNNILNNCPGDETALTNAICCFRQQQQNAAADDLSARLSSNFPQSFLAMQRQRLRDVFAAEAAADVPL